MEYVKLGKTAIEISQLGIGAWAWGDRVYWSYGEGYDEADIQRLFERSVQVGITFFDTAESYGWGKSEEILGRLLRNSDRPLIVATKFAPYPWRFDSGALARALDRSLQRLGVEQVDLYQIHFPHSLRTTASWVSALGQAASQGKVRAVGVSNYSRDQMLRARDLLEKWGIPLASNQVDYSLLNREVETSGLLEACRENEITLIAYSPLAQGLLTGKYTLDNPPPGIRRLRYPPGLLKKASELVDLMTKIGAAHSGKTPAQIAVNWLYAKGSVPIPGVKTLDQLEEQLGSLGWALEPAEIADLDQLSAALS